LVTAVIEILKFVELITHPKPILASGLVAGGRVPIFPVAI